ncbi:hypothetical protein [Thalassoglobus polymorphus]|uniref:Uncharacterized protein n=1 Tax=Thalassoglobus polymorphus TaxID=2527994 RepID=A0A517QKM5_9PLAN|nr:hypothetical protein [Thalassoglobus polymorphus]QDT32185.1 hypothetical protein Mal48_14270 [Thalassoglobus polymorphus]
MKLHVDFDVIEFFNQFEELTLQQNVSERNRVKLKKESDRAHLNRAIGKR